MNINTEEFLAFLATITVIVCIVWVNFNYMKKDESVRLELAKKYPECVQACKPTVCLRYKYKLERYCND